VLDSSAQAETTACEVDAEENPVLDLGENLCAMDVPNAGDRPMLESDAHFVCMNFAEFQSVKPLFQVGSGVQLFQKPKTHMNQHILYALISDACAMLP